jgi:hypothetical protein
VRLSKKERVKKKIERCLRIKKREWSHKREKRKRTCKEKRKGKDQFLCKGE